MFLYAIDLISVLDNLSRASLDTKCDQQDVQLKQIQLRQDRKAVTADIAVLATGNNISQLPTVLSPLFRAEVSEVNRLVIF